MENRVLEMKDLRPGFNNKKCVGCEFNGGSNLGTHHVSCKKKNAIVTVSEHGRKNGWASWPFDFDSIWIETCDSYMNVDQYKDMSDKEMKILLQGFVLYGQEKVRAFKSFADMAQSSVARNSNLQLGVEILKGLNDLLDSMADYKYFILDIKKEINEEERKLLKDFLIKAARI